MFVFGSINHKIINIFPITGLNWNNNRINKYFDGKDKTKLKYSMIEAEESDYFWYLKNFDLILVVVVIYYIYL